MMIKKYSNKISITLYRLTLLAAITTNALANTHSTLKENLDDFSGYWMTVSDKPVNNHYPIQSIVHIQATKDNSNQKLPWTASIHKALINVVDGKAVAPDKTCIYCKGALKNKNMTGLTIIQGGQIMDPASGKYYRVALWKEKDHPNELNVRGYIFLFYRTQIWYKISKNYVGMIEENCSLGAALKQKPKITFNSHTISFDQNNTKDSFCYIEH